MPREHEPEPPAARAPRGLRVAFLAVVVLPLAALTAFVASLPAPG